MLWIALRVPQLPLEIFLRGAPTPEPFAIAEGHCILACDSKASRRGVQPGMTASTALMLAPRLIVRARDPAAETEALLGLAAWMTQFTPSVVLEFPDSLLMEVSSSLKLLGGLQAILARLQSGILDMGFSAVMACAPTVRAALWIARSLENHPAVSDGHAYADLSQLTHAIAGLPLKVLDNADIIAGLEAIGAASMADVLALPRDGLVRRFGQQLIDDMDRALGKLAEPRTFFRAPEKFQAGIELPSEATQAEALLFAARRLFMQLSGFLTARSAGVQSITVKLAHRETITTILVGMASPSRDSAHFTLLLRERLANLTLREPVRSIAIAAEEVMPLAGRNLGLFAKDGMASDQSAERLMEKLRARLGNEMVQGVSAAADHRPERACIAVDPGLQQLTLNFNERPFWLLAAPRPIQEINFMPHYEEGPLELIAGPERIESGWWDSEAMRDYFIARSQSRSLLWIYRERHRGDAGKWFLHGIFA